MQLTYVSNHRNKQINDSLKVAVKTDSLEWLSIDLLPQLTEKKIITKKIHLNITSQFIRWVQFFTPFIFKDLK